MSEEDEKSGGDEGGAGGDDELLEALNEVDLEGFDLEESVLPADGGSDDAGKGDDKPPEKKDDRNLETDEIRELRAERDRLRNDKNDLKKALHEARQEKKTEKVELSDTQILAILEEHRDNPEVLLNTIKFVAKQQAAGAKKEAVDDVEVSNTKKELDAYCTRMYGERWTGDDSDLRQGVQKAKEHLKINDHPYGDFMALGMNVLMNIDKIQKAAFDKGAESVQKGDAEKNREDSIKNGSLSKGKGPTGAGSGKGRFGLTADQLDTAKRLGLTTDAQLRTYATQILKGKPRKEG